MSVSCISRYTIYKHKRLLKKKLLETQFSFLFCMHFPEIYLKADLDVCVHAYNVENKRIADLNSKWNQLNPDAKNRSLIKFVLQTVKLKKPVKKICSEIFAQIHSSIFCEMILTF